MFNWLGRSVIRRPITVIVSWLLLAVLGLLGTFWGFGQGGLFDRMATTQVLTPGSESEKVNHLTSGEDSQQAITYVISGIDLKNDLPGLVEVMATQREKIADIDGVAEVKDPLVVPEKPAQPQTPQLPAGVDPSQLDPSQLPAGVDPSQLPAGVDPSQLPAGVDPSQLDPSQLPEGTVIPGMPDLQSPENQALLSKKGDGFVVAVTLEKGLSDDAAEKADSQVISYSDDLQSALQEKAPEAKVQVVAQSEIESTIMGQVQSDLVKGESIGLPVALILLVVIFGGLVAAGLPLVGALTAIGIGMGIVWALTFSMDISSFILNVVSLIGLALSIDYGLLVVSRYREEIAEELEKAGYPSDGTTLPERSVVNDLVKKATFTTVKTAGRTVFFSAMTIAFSIAGLLVFSSNILRTIGISGIVVTLFAVFTAITMVPAIIVLLGNRLVRPSMVSKFPGIKQLIKLFGDSSSDHGAFSKLAEFVHKWPIPILIIVVAILSLMASPIGDLRMRSSFMEYLPEDSASRIAYQTMNDNYPALATPEIEVVVEAAPEDPAVQTVSDQITNRYPEVSYIVPSAINDSDMTKLAVHLDVDDPVGDRVVDIVKDMRNTDFEDPVLIGGGAAMQTDFVDSLGDRALWAGLIVVAAVMILLFLMTGSVIVPLKALIVNSFSLVASLGATVWIFHGGHFGMPQVNGLETYIVAVMIAFGFGLAMDYEVFLIARIKEYWDAGYDNDTAVERGLQRSGRIITSAAAIIVAVFLGFVAGNMLAIKQIGVALAITVIADATLVRLLLVPATMTIIGKWNWWAPKPLRKLHERFHIDH